MRRVEGLPTTAFVLASLQFLASPVIAQDKPGDNKDDKPPAAPKDTPDKASKNPPPADDNKPTPTDKPAPAPTDKNDKNDGDANKDDKNGDDKDNADKSSTDKNSEKPTPSSEKSSATPSVTPPPKSTPDSSNNDDDNLSSFPTLTGGGALATHAPPAVPPTKDAPFMQQSTLPDGTVFIAVGSILGALGLAVLLWRVIVSCMLHRSVERAAKAQYSSSKKTGFPAPPAPFYKYTDQGSTMSIAGGSGRGVRRTNRGQTPSTNLSQSNLFFSPTAAASNQGGARGSSFLPSGFYAAGSAANSPSSYQYQQTYSMTNLRPESRGHQASASRNTLNISPPDSPQMAARRDYSTSSLNLSASPGPGQRAPSAYLDDLLADDPGSLPPRGMTPSGQRNRSDSPQHHRR